MSLGGGAPRFDVGRAVIDTRHSKLVVVGTTNFKPELRICERDGSACVAHALSSVPGLYTKLALDPVHDTIYVAYSKLAGGASMLVRCDSSGERCITRDREESHGPSAPSDILVDARGQKVIFSSVSGQSGPFITRCSLDLSDCVDTLIPSSGSLGMGAALDERDGRLVILSRWMGPPPLRPTRMEWHVCARDVTGCVTKPAGPGGMIAEGEARVMFDPVRRTVSYVATNQAHGGDTGYVWCAADATGCKLQSMTGRGNPISALDPKTGGLSVLAEHPSDGLLALTSCDARGTRCATRPTGLRDVSSEAAIVAQDGMVTLVSREDNETAKVGTCPATQTAPCPSKLLEAPPKDNRLMTSEASFVEPSSSDVVTLVRERAGVGPTHLMLLRCRPDGSGCSEKRLPFEDSAYHHIGSVSFGGDAVFIQSMRQTVSDIRMDRCTLDGASCATVGRGKDLPHVVTVDPSGTLFGVSIPSRGDAAPPSQVRCDVKGCTATPMVLSDKRPFEQAEAPLVSGTELSFVAHRVTLKPYTVVTTSTLVRCQTSTGACTESAIDAGEPESGDGVDHGHAPPPRTVKRVSPAVRDPRSNTLVRVGIAIDPSGHTQSFLLACPLDGSACTERPITVGDYRESLGALTLDHERGLVYGYFGTPEQKKLGIVRCALANASCSVLPITLAEEAHPGGALVLTEGGKRVSGVLYTGSGGLVHAWVASPAAMSARAGSH